MWWADPVVTTQHPRPFPAQVGKLSEIAKAPATPALGQDGEAGHINKEMEATTAEIQTKHRSRCMLNINPLTIQTN